MYVYDMPELHQIEFERMRGFVEDAYRDSIRGNIRSAPMELTIATQNLSRTPFRAKSGKAEGKYVGFAWPGAGNMWVKPGRPDFDMKRTTIHELSHLRVNVESHGPKFRRVFGVALAMYMRGLGKDWADIRGEIHDIVFRYRSYRTYTPQGRYNYYSDYQNRCRDEIDSILEAAKRVCQTSTTLYP